MQLIRQVEPKNVLLVHGERAKMAFLKQKIVRELNINCYDPPNGVSVTIPTAHSVPLNISTQLMKREYERFAESQQQDAGAIRATELCVSRCNPQSLSTHSSACGRRSTTRRSRASW